MSYEQEERRDPLLECLVIYTKIMGTPYTAEALVAGLPVEPERSTPELFSLKSSKSGFSRAAKRAGFVSKIVQRELVDIPKLVLPAILVLKNNNACILVDFDNNKEHAKIIMPDVSDGEQWVKLEDLKEEYLGIAFFLKREFKYEEKKLNLLDEKKGHWFWGTLIRSKSIYSDALIASFVINLFVLATPLFTMNVYDRVVPNSATDTLLVLSLGVFMIYVFDLILKFVRAYFLEIAGKKSDVILSSMIFEKILSVKMENQPKSVGSFASNIKEFDHIRNFLASSTIATLVDLPFVVIFLIVIFSLAGSLVLAPLVVILLIFAYSYYLQKPLDESVKQTFEATAKKNGVLIESLNGIETIKILGAGGHAQWNWEESVGEISNKSIKTKMLSTSLSVGTSFLVQLSTILVIFFGAYAIKDMEITMGALVAVMLLSSRTIAPMGQMAALLANFEQTKAAYEMLQNIMELPVERPDGKKFVQRPSFSGKIEFKNVSFSYAESQKGALNNISFTINPGEKVAILGKIGSGKSTILKLLAGLYTPTSGSLLIDGIDINQIDPADLRRNIGYVPQDIVLFSGTVKKNITYRAPSANDETMIKAAKVGGVTDFVNNHPLGFDLMVGERGANLSGGQRQGIAIARAFLLECSIVLLDEPTNSMDSSTEGKVINELRDAVAQNTLLLVTHKYTLLQLVDRVIVVDNGNILLDGPKDQVMQKLQGGQK